MSRGLELGVERGGLVLPLDAQTATQLVLGGKGMGKTNYGAVLVEEIAAQGLRFSVVDPLDNWWGLQHGASPAHQGLDVVILGGTHGDIPIEPTAGAVVADFVADEAVNTVIALRRADGRMWTRGEKIRFVATYAERLYERQGERRIPLLQVIDEAGRYCPQVAGKHDVDIAKCLGALEQLVEEGRNVGVGVCLITQRSARINKSVAELADSLVAFRTVGPRSVDAIVDWFGDHVAREHQKALIEQLRALDQGTALVVSPGWLKREGAAQIRRRRTFDSSATPKPGKALRAPGRARKPDLAQYEQRMAATIEKAKAEDPKELRRRIQSLERNLAAARAAKPAAAPAPKIERREVPVLAPAVARQLEQSARRIERVTHELVELGTILEGRWRQVREALATVTGAPRLPVRPSPPAVAPAPPSRADTIPATPRAMAAKANVEREPTTEGNAPPSRMEQRMLVALAQHPTGLTKGQILLHTGYRSSGPVSNAFAHLHRAGWVNGDRSQVRITPTGLAVLGSFEPLPTGDALRQELLTGSTLAKMERALLGGICAAFPGPIAKGDVLEQTGYRASGPVSNAFARLVRYGYVRASGPSLLCAAEELFG